ncbi:MAG TPA: RdgB/HAM1 family non-canonical purine NTP pyrophosphatase [Acidothermaceae bacterium]
MTRVVLATRNAHKVIELRRILTAAGLDVDLVGMDAYPHVPEVPETGATFEDNALLKARAVARATGEIALANDSGLAVNALNGMPGVLSARWAGRPGSDSDEANLRLVLAQIADVPDQRLGAWFECAAAAVFPDDREFVVRGRLAGSITRIPRGSNGFGYDPIFIPAGGDRTTAELGDDEKDAISHRGVAFRALAAQLQGLIEPR